MPTSRSSRCCNEEGEFSPADTNLAGASPGRLGTELERPQVTHALRQAVAVPEVLRKHRSCCVFQGLVGGASAGLFLSELPAFVAGVC